MDANGATVHQFDGDIKLQLLAINLEVDAVLVIGSALKPDGHSHTFFAIYLAAELPAGIHSGARALRFTVWRDFSRFRWSPTSLPTRNGMAWGRTTAGLTPLRSE